MNVYKGFELFISKFVEKCKKVLKKNRNYDIVILEFFMRIKKILKGENTHG